MKIKEIKNEINNNPPNICMVYGNEPYFLDSIEKEILEHPMIQFPEMNLSFFEGSEAIADEIEKVTMTYPFGCEKRFIVVKDPSFLKEKNKVDEEDNAESSIAMDIFLNTIETIPDTSCLFVLLTNVPDKRRKYLSEIRKKGKVFDIEKLTRQDMEKWISYMLKASGKQISVTDLEILLDYSGYYEKNSEKNMYDIENLVKKLISFMGEKKNVERSMLLGIAPRNLELDIFKLVDTLSVRNISHGIRIYEDMIKDGEAPMRILATIVSQIRISIICGMSEANHESMEVMKKKAGSNSDYYMKMNLKRAKSVGYKKLLSGLNRCLETEFNIKSGKMQEKLAMEMLFVGIFD